MRRKRGTWLESARRSAAATLLAACAVAALPSSVRAQVASGDVATLTLARAIRVAERGNPDYLRQANDEAPAVWGEREAWSQLLLPSVSTALGLQYQAPGSPNFGIFTSQDIGLGRTPAYYFSNYSLTLGYTLDAATVLGPWRARAQRRAASARTDAARFTLVAMVTGRYVGALRAQEAARLAARELARARSNAELAVARVKAGAAPPLDSLQAQLQEARAQASVAEAETGRRTARLRLGETLGAALPKGVELTSTFEVFDPPWPDDTLLAWAASRNPQLRAARADEKAERAQARVARAAYLPRLDLRAGWSGYTREAADAALLVAQAKSSAAASVQSCQLMNEISAGLSQPLPDRPADCSRYAFTDAQRQQIVAHNNAFPVDFSPQPAQVQLTVSLPIFTGFSRQQQLSAAAAAAADAHYAVRKQRLTLRTDVEAMADSLRTLFGTVSLESRSRDLAATQLELARERYRLGAGSFLELQQAEAQKTQADRDYLDSEFRFHETLAALAALVGRPLRPEL